MHFYKNSQLPVSVAITPGQIAKNDCFDQVNRRFERLHESIWHARIFIVRQRITLQNSNDYLRQIDCLGFAGSVAKRNAGCQDPAHCLSGFLSKAGSFLPGFIFFLVHLQEIASPCAGVRSYRKRSLPPLLGRVSAQGVAVPAAGCIVGIEKRPHPRTKRRG